MACQTLCACPGAVVPPLGVARTGCSGSGWSAREHSAVSACLHSWHIDAARIGVCSWILRDRVSFKDRRKRRHPLTVAALDEQTQGREGSDSSSSVGAIKTEVPAARGGAAQGAGTGFGSTSAGNAKAGAKKGQSTKSSKKAEVRRLTPERPLLTPETTGSPESRQIETFAVGSLVLLFAIILVEGVFLGAAGFLPDEWDEFALNTVYPSFSPTIALLFAGSAAYGAFKYFNGGR